MDYNEIVQLVENLKRKGICLEDIQRELDYRDNASYESRWDDNLFEYSTEELINVEHLWYEVS